MEVYVLDTSVLIKTIRPGERYAEMVDRVIEDYAREAIEIHVPMLCWYEVFNYLSREYPPPDCMRLFRGLLDCDFYTRDFTQAEYELAAEWVARSKNQRVAAYDVLFHVMAYLKNGIFLTADEKYYNAMRGKGAICFISKYKITS